MHAALHFSLILGFRTAVMVLLFSLLGAGTVITAGRNRRDHGDCGLKAMKPVSSMKNVE